jgi:hypothetical protein
MPSKTTRTLSTIKTYLMLDAAQEFYHFFVPELEPKKYLPLT